MSSVRSLLRCTYYLAATVLSCGAFSPSSKSMVNHNSDSASYYLSSLSLSADSNYSGTDDIKCRRSFIGNILTTTIATTATIALLPVPSFAADDEVGEKVSRKPKRLPLSVYLYSILRAREATEQESRLISTGKFKDVQRANVKLAIKFIINNYKLSDSIIAASSYLTGNDRVKASGVGQSGVQSLFTIVEYFDSSDVENIKVDSLSGKEDIVVNGLKSVRRDIDDFISFFPKEEVEEAKAKIMRENELNFKEFDPSLGSILNPNP